MPVSAYRQLLSRAGVARLLAAATLGRLPFGMAGLAILLLVRDAGGSYAIAGVAAGAYGLGLGLAGPLIARTIDRRGPWAVLVPLGVVAPGVLALLPLVARAGTVELVPAALLAGAATPPLGACLRALWTPVLGDTTAVQTAFALESIVQELVFICGPLLVVVCIALAGPAAAVLASAALLATGTLWFATAPAARTAPGSGTRHADWLGPLRSAGLRRVLSATALLAIGLGAISVALPAAADHAGHRDRAGLLLAVWAVGSMSGGLLIAGRSLGLSPGRRLALLIACSGGCALPLAGLSSLVAIGAVVALSGVWIAPSIACAYGLVDRLAPPGTTTEAFAWSGTTFSAGSALGEGLAGLVISRQGASGGFLLATAAMLAAAAIGLRALPQAAGTGASAGSLSTPSDTSRSAVSSRAL